MTAFLDDVARAALPVAVMLLLLAAAARAVLWARVPDATLQRLAHEHLEPLTTWCVIAVIVDVIAVGGAAGMGVASIGVPLLLAAGAVVLRPAGESAEAAPAPPRPAPAVERPASSAPEPGTAPLWSEPRAEDGRPATGLWSR